MIHLGNDRNGRTSKYALWMSFLKTSAATGGNCICHRRLTRNRCNSNEHNEWCASTLYAAHAMTCTCTGLAPDSQQRQMKRVSPRVRLDSLRCHRRRLYLAPVHDAIPFERFAVMHGASIVPTRTLKQKAVFEILSTEYIVIVQV